MFDGFQISTILFIVILILFFTNAVKILREYERGVIFRLGRLSKALIGGNGPGIIILIPGIDKMEKVSLRSLSSPQIADLVRCPMTRAFCQHTADLFLSSRYL